MSNTKKRITNLFTRISYKINLSKDKNNALFLNLDLLTDQIQKDLLSIVSKNLEQTYLNLLDQPNATMVMEKNYELIFFQLLRKTSEEFLTLQYGPKIKLSHKALETSLYTKSLKQDLDILFAVPFYTLLKPSAAQFRFIYSPVYTKASQSFIEALIDNLVIEIANCIVYFNMTHFSLLPSFRQIFYRSKFISSRNFERYKNNLTWQLNYWNTIQRPARLYNNRHQLYILRTSGIYTRVVYANRTNHLQKLSGLPLLTITLIECKDFIIARLEEFIYSFSSGFRYLLTSVLGNIIGLIWRGIIEGLKN